MTLSLWSVKTMSYQRQGSGACCRRSNLESLEGLVWHRTWFFVPLFRPSPPLQAGLRLQRDRHQRPNTKTAQTSWAVLVSGCGDTQLPNPTFASDRSLRRDSPRKHPYGVDRRHPKRCTEAATGMTDLGPEAVGPLSERARRIADIRQRLGGRDMAALNLDVQPDLSAKGRSAGLWRRAYSPPVARCHPRLRTTRSSPDFNSCSIRCRESSALPMPASAASMIIEIDRSGAPIPAGQLGCRPRSLVVDHRHGVQFD